MVSCAFNMPSTMSHRSMCNSCKNRNPKKLHQSPHLGVEPAWEPASTQGLWELRPHLQPQTGAAAEPDEWTHCRQLSQSWLDQGSWAWSSHHICLCALTSTLLPAPLFVQKGTTFLSKNILFVNSARPEVSLYLWSKLTV